MGARNSAALLAGRAAAVLSRRLGRGGGTVIAGHLVPRLAPNALRDVTVSLPHGSIVVSGTNGKTTTTRLLSHILRSAGLRPIHNRAGANLLSGLFTAIAQETDWRGRPRGDIGLFEVDEATVPAALTHVRPRVLLLHNIFRDQLDRYGEVHFVAGLWREAAARLSTSTTLVANADDPLLADLRAGLTYGVADEALGSATLPHAMDARLCPRCGASLRYQRVYYGHLGHYACSRCEFARPTPAVVATSVELLGDAGSNLVVATPDGVMRARLHLPGLYNVYNAVAAVAVCHVLGVPREVVARGIETFTAAFGRVERIAVEDRTDLSWLWDVEFEQLVERVNVAVCSGLRAEDMAVRLKYAGIEPARIVVENDPRRAIERTLAAAEPQETVYVLPTYTAMLAIRDILRQT